MSNVLDVGEIFLCLMFFLCVIMYHLGSPPFSLCYKIFKCFYPPTSASTTISVYKSKGKISQISGFSLTFWEERCLVYDFWNSCAFFLLLNFNISKFSIWENFKIYLLIISWIRFVNRYEILAGPKLCIFMLYIYVRKIWEKVKKLRDNLANGI